jgi:hypothetical protein
MYVNINCAACNRCPRTVRRNGYLCGTPEVCGVLQEDLWTVHTVEAVRKEGRKGYRGYSKTRTRTVLGSYSRALPRSIGPP